jgi:hypothetical protein
MAVWHNSKPIPSYHASQRASGQHILSGTDPAVSTTKGIFFLEMLQCASGVTLTSGDGKLVITGATSFSQDQSPIRFDEGLSITGTVVFAKGFMIEGML